MPPAAEQFLKGHAARLHDRVRINSGGHSYEGRVMPVHRFSGDHVVVLKLANGLRSLLRGPTAGCWLDRGGGRREVLA